MKILKYIIINHRSAVYLVTLKWYLMQFYVNEKIRNPIISCLKTVYATIRNPKVNQVLKQLVVHLNSQNVNCRTIYTKHFDVMSRCFFAFVWGIWNVCSINEFSFIYCLRNRINSTIDYWFARIICTFLQNKKCTLLNYHFQLDDSVLIIEIQGKERPDDNSRTMI